MLNDEIYCADLLHKVEGWSRKYRVGCQTNRFLIWEVKVPSKIKIFTWRLLLDRLPTRVQLKKRIIIPNTEENWCTSFSERDEDLLHLLFHYHFFVYVWQHVQLWLDKVVLVWIDPIEYFLKHFNSFKGTPGKTRKSSFGKNPLRELLGVYGEWGMLVY